MAFIGSNTDVQDHSLAFGKRLFWSNLVDLKALLGHLLQKQRIAGFVGQN